METKQEKIFQDIPKDVLPQYIQKAKDRGFENIEVHESTWRTSNIWGEKPNRTKQNWRIKTMCSQCEALMINGVYCHETGCPMAHRHTVRECKWCGQNFCPEHQNDYHCSVSCYNAYYDTDYEEQ